MTYKTHPNLEIRGEAISVLTLTTGEGRNIKSTFENLCSATIEQLQPSVILHFMGCLHSCVLLKCFPEKERKRRNWKLEELTRLKKYLMLSSNLHKTN